MWAKIAKLQNVCFEGILIIRNALICYSLASSFREDKAENNDVL